MTPLQANIIIILLVVTIAVIITAALALWDALHTLILQGNQRREWNREKVSK